MGSDSEYLSNPSSEALRSRVRWWVGVLENQFEFLGYRFGWDAILALIPGGGNLISLFPAALIVGLGYQMGAPLSVLLRMCLRLGLEWIMGLVPVLGTLGDIFYKANSRNAETLDRWLQSPQTEQRGARWFVAIVLGAVLGTGFALSFMVVWLIWSLMKTLVVA